MPKNFEQISLKQSQKDALRDLQRPIPNRGTEIYIQ
jgi:hypothetical protein